MSKWFEVEITAVKVVCVEMPDEATEEEAVSFAWMECGLDPGFITESTQWELKDAQQRDTAIRHADQVEYL